MNCNSTERIVSNMISLYDQCASVHIANKYLSQAAIDLYHMLNDLYQAHKNNTENRICNKLETSEMTISEMTISDHNETKVWCIME